MNLTAHLIQSLDNPQHLWQSMLSNFPESTRIAILTLPSCTTPVDLVDWQAAVSRVSGPSSMHFEQALRTLDDMFITLKRPWGSASTKRTAEFRNPSIEFTWYQCHTVGGEKLCQGNDDSLCPRYDAECVKGVRVTFIDPDTGKYAHVLLAYPFINDSGNATYMSLRTQQTAAGESLHAGGVAWYGNYLYVADTARGVRVFDMRYIFDLKAAGEKGDTSDKHQIGRQNGVFYGHGYRYVMPEVAAYTNNVPRPPADERCQNVGSPNTSFVSIDRSGIDHLITGEYCAGRTPEDGEAGGRVAAWPLDGSTGKPDINSTCTSRIPVHHMYVDGVGDRSEQARPIGEAPPIGAIGRVEAVLSALSCGVAASTRREPGR